MWLHLKQGWGALLGERPECLLGWWQYSVCCEVLVTQVYTFVKTYWSDEHLRSMDFIVCKLDLNKIFLKIKKIILCTLFYVFFTTAWERNTVQIIPCFMFQKSSVQMKNCMTCLRSHSWDKNSVFSLLSHSSYHTCCLVVETEPQHTV